MHSFQLNAKLFLILLLAAVSAYAQPPEIAKKINFITNSSEYYWGEGAGKTAELADKAALSMLINSISVQVKSTFVEITTQVETNKEVNFTDAVNTQVKTYSHATLTNTEKRSWGKEPNAQAFLFIKKTKVDSIFIHREEKVKELVREALKAEANVQVADALRDYYWALNLLRSLPKAGSVKMDIAGETQILSLFLPRRIKDVFRNLDFAVAGKEPDENLTKYRLYITYKNQPVVNCEYSFSDGRNWSVPVAAKDGHGISDMAGHADMHEEQEVKIEYIFENEWNIDNDVKDVMQGVEPVLFPESYLKVPLGGKLAKPKKAATPTIKQADGKPYIPLLERVERQSAPKTTNRHATVSRPKGTTSLNG
jgi:hypothetical protein